MGSLKPFTKSLVYYANLKYEYGSSGAEAEERATLALAEDLEESPNVGGIYYATFTCNPQLNSTEGFREYADQEMTKLKYMNQKILSNPDVLLILKDKWMKADLRDRKPFIAKANARHIIKRASARKAARGAAVESAETREEFISSSTLCATVKVSAVVRVWFRPMHQQYYQRPPLGYASRYSRPRQSPGSVAAAVARKRVSCAAKKWRRIDCKRSNGADR